MADPITLPPLPEPAGFRTRYRSEPGMIGHYPWTYSDKQRRWSILADLEHENLHTADQLRARDIEVARLVLDGAKGALVQASIEAKRGTDRAVLTAAAIIVRALEVRHHE